MSGKKNYTLEEVLQHVFADPDSDNNENSDIVSKNFKHLLFFYHYRNNIIRI